MSCPVSELETAVAVGLDPAELLELLCEHLARFGSPVDKTRWSQLGLRERRERVQSALDALASRRASH